MPTKFVYIVSSKIEYIVIDMSSSFYLPCQTLDVTSVYPHYGNRMASSAATEWEAAYVDSPGGTSGCDDGARCDGRADADQPVEDHFADECDRASSHLKSGGDDDETLCDSVSSVKFGEVGEKFTCDSTYSSEFGADGQIKCDSMSSSSSNVDGYADDPGCVDDFGDRDAAREDLRLSIDILHDVLVDLEGDDRVHIANATEAASKWMDEHPDAGVEQLQRVKWALEEFVDPVLAQMPDFDDARDCGQKANGSKTKRPKKNKKRLKSKKPTYQNKEAQISNFDCTADDADRLTLENYCFFIMGNAIADQKPQFDLIEMAVQDTLQWLDSNGHASKADLSAKKNELATRLDSIQSDGHASSSMPNMLSNQGLEDMD